MNATPVNPEHSRGPFLWIFDRKVLGVNAVVARVALTSLVGS